MLFGDRGDQQHSQHHERVACAPTSTRACGECTDASGAREVCRGREMEDAADPCRGVRDELVPDEQVGQGTRFVDCSSDDVTAGPQCVPAGGVLHPKLPLPGSEEHILRPDACHQDQDQVDPGELSGAGTDHRAPLVQIRLRLRGVNQGAQASVRERHQDGGDAVARSRVHLDGIGWEGQAPLQVHVLPGRRDRRTASSEGRAESRDSSAPRARGAAATKDHERLEQHWCEGSSPISSLLETAWSGGEGSGKGSFAGEFGSTSCRPGGSTTVAEEVDKVAPRRRVRGRFDSGPAQAGTRAAGEVGRVSPVMGGVALHGAGGRSGGDVGGEVDCDEHGGLCAVAIEAAFLKRPGRGRPRSTSPAIRACQRKDCAETAKLVRQLQSDLKRTHEKLAHEQKMRAVLVRGEVRNERMQDLDKMEQLQTRNRELKRATDISNVYRKQLEVLSAEHVELMENIAALGAEVSDLRAQLASHERKAAADARATARDARKAGHTSAIGDAKKLVESARAQAEKQVRAAEKRADDAERRADEAGQLASEAVSAADKSREAAVAALEEAANAKQAKGDAEYLMMLTTRREKAAKEKAARLEKTLESKQMFHPFENRSVDELAALSRAAEKQDEYRKRKYLTNFLTSHEWRVGDLAFALNNVDGLVEKLFHHKIFFAIHYKRLEQLMEQMKEEHFGVSFGLYLHYELRLTLPKIVQLAQAGSKAYERLTDRYRSKALMYHPYLKDEHGSGGSKYIPVVRISPPRSKLEPAIRKLEAQIGIKPGEDGQLALKSFTVVVQEILAKDPGTHSMPPLPFFLGGVHELPIVISFDATGFGCQQFNTIAARNPYLPQSAQLLRVFGLGNCADNKGGTTRLLGENRKIINDLIVSQGCSEYEVDGKAVVVRPKIYVVTDVSALRHTEHLSASGWCGCSSEFALRQTPKQPKSVDEMHSLLQQCRCPTRLERYIWSHNPLPGEELPRPCTAPGCTFAHDRLAASQQLADLRAKEAELSAVDTKSGKTQFSKWRMDHAHSHYNVQPGLYGLPMLEHDLDDQILDPLHYAELGLPKTPWKHGILHNASDDAREAISQQLKEWNHPLDTRKKDDGRAREQKWFSGEKWASFCAGTGGSPGGPMAIAKIVHIIAEDMQWRGVSLGSGEIDTEAVKSKTVMQRTSGKSSFAARGQIALTGNPKDTARAEPTSLTHVPTAKELDANPADLNMIKELYGSRAQTIINTLLAFDAYFSWYYALKDNDASLFCDMDVRERQAFDNCCKAIEMHEVFERLAIRKHKSYLPHAAIFKTSRDILRVGDVWAFSLSALELQNAETKRVGRDSGSRRMKLSTSGQARVSLRAKEGPTRLITTKGYSTTLALSTLRNLLVAQNLRSGDGILSTPESRRKERLFGESGKGRLTLTSAGVKIEKIGADYDPQADTCLKAFVRLLAEVAASRSMLQESEHSEDSQFALRAQ